jgi:hypothetical protein
MNQFWYYVQDGEGVSTTLLTGRSLELAGAMGEVPLSVDSPSLSLAGEGGAVSVSGGGGSLSLGGGNRALDLDGCD